MCRGNIFLSFMEVKVAEIAKQYYIKTNSKLH